LSEACYYYDVNDKTFGVKEFTGQEIKTRDKERDKVDILLNDDSSHTIMRK